jgi:hypothetical protein
MSHSVDCAPNVFAAVLRQAARAYQRASADGYSPQYLNVVYIQIHSRAHAGNIPRLPNTWTEFAMAQQFARPLTADCPD